MRCQHLHCKAQKDVTVNSGRAVLGDCIWVGARLRICFGKGRTEFYWCLKIGKDFVGAASSRDQVGRANICNRGYSAKRQRDASQNESHQT